VPRRSPEGCAVRCAPFALFPRHVPRWRASRSSSNVRHPSVIPTSRTPRPDRVVAAGCDAPLTALPRTANYGSRIPEVRGRVRHEPSIRPLLPGRVVDPDDPRTGPSRPRPQCDRSRSGLRARPARRFGRHARRCRARRGARRRRGDRRRRSSRDDHPSRHVEQPHAHHAGDRTDAARARWRGRARLRLRGQRSGPERRDPAGAARARVVRLDRGPRAGSRSARVRGLRHAALQRVPGVGGQRTGRQGRVRTRAADTWGSRRLRVAAQRIARAELDSVDRRSADSRATGDRRDLLAHARDGGVARDAVRRAPPTRCRRSA
jgi:hypothetical protein